MIPAAFVGVVFNDQIEALFAGNLLLVGSMLVLTGFILFATTKVKRKRHHIGFINAALLGIAQAIAILPGVSRSGATIGTALILGVERTRAARFSFLMVIPLIMGKMAKDLMDMDMSVAMQETSVLPLVVGFVAAFVTGLLACTWMVELVKRSKLIYFAFYCFVVGAIAIGYTMI